MSVSKAQSLWSALERKESVGFTDSLSLRENGVRKELNVAPRENGRNNREVTSGRKEFQLRTKTNDMGKLPEGVTLNYQKVNRRSEKEIRKGRKG